jgi:hypothetical protein
MTDILHVPGAGAKETGPARTSQAGQVTLGVARRF